MNEPVRLLLVRHGRTAWNASGRYMGQMDVPLDEVGLAQARAVAARLQHERPAAIISSDLQRAIQTAEAIQRAIDADLERATRGESIPTPKIDITPGRLPGPAGGQPAIPADAPPAVVGLYSPDEKAAPGPGHERPINAPGKPARQTSSKVSPGSMVKLLLEPRLREMNFGAWQGKTYAEIQRDDPGKLAAWETDMEAQAPPGGELLTDFAWRVRQAYEDAISAYPGQTLIIVAHGGPLQMLLTHAMQLPVKRFWQWGLSNTGWSELNIYPAGAILNRLNDTGHLEHLSP